MNKTIKRIVALGSGSLMLGATIMGALAYDLSNYPSPFVQNGVFQGKIVIGSQGPNAAGIASDMLGAIDIATSLQRASTSVVSVGGTTQTATAADGYHFEENNFLILGSDLNAVMSSVDDTELPDLLKSGTVEADDGSEYDYDVEIQFPSASTNVVSGDITANELDDMYTTPVVYFDMATGATDTLYSIVVDFEDTWDAEDFVNSETIELLGRAYTFDPNNEDGDDLLTLFGSDSTLLVAKGEQKTLTYNGKQFTIEVLGGNSDDSTAILRVASDTRTVGEGDSKTIGGLPVYIKDVFVSNIGTQEVSVQLFVGSNKLELDAGDGSVKLNSIDLDEVTVATNTGNWTDVETITFTVVPVDGEGEIEYILPEKSYVDPLFGSFKLEFVGSKDLKAGKEALEFTRNGAKLDIKFTPRDATEPTSFTFGEDNMTHDDLWNQSTMANMAEDTIFFYNDGSAADDYVTHVLQVTSVKHGDDPSDDDFQIVVKDLSHDKTYNVDSNTSAVDSDIGLYAKTGSDADHIGFGTAAAGGATAYLPILYTEAGAEVKFQFLNSTGSWNDIVSGAEIIGGTRNRFVIDEDVESDEETSTPTTWNVGLGWDAEDDEYDISADLGTELDDDDNADHYLTAFGSYVIVETDDAGKYVYNYIPAKEVAYDMFLLPVSSAVTVVSSSNSGAVSINPIAVGMAITDSEATLGSKPYIVIGGPCVNSVAMALMGSPAECWTGFTEGKAKIKLYTANNALLVAGFAAKDTQGATGVLSNYKDYALTGTEVEVVTASLTDLKVNKVG